MNAIVLDIRAVAVQQHCEEDEQGEPTGSHEQAREDEVAQLAGAYVVRAEDVHALCAKLDFIVCTVYNIGYYFCMK